MGLFDIFKKEKAGKRQQAVSVNFSPVTPVNNEYIPWGKNGITINDNYAIAAFIRISRSGAKIGSTNDDYARYFNYRFGVYDPISYHKKVIDAGYLVEASVETALKKLKVDQLKAILADAGLPNKGKKDELISMIMENIDDSELKLEKYYVPSEKGLAHLKKYEYIFTSENYGVSCKEYEAQKELSQDSVKTNDIIWQSLNKGFNEHNTAGDYGLARNDLLGMAQLLESEERHVDALFRFCLVLYYDTSGCSNGRLVDALDDVTIAPAIVDAIRKLKPYYDPQIISRYYERYKLPHHYISKQNFERLIFAIFNGEPIDIHDFV